MTLFAHLLLDLLIIVIITLNTYFGSVLDPSKVSQRVVLSKMSYLNHLTSGEDVG